MKTKLKGIISIKRIKLDYLLIAILVIGFIIRMYRAGDLLGFYYDQGRDALIIWDLWHSGKFFLIGPVTGLAGVFLGPLYYYLIAPFYLLGGGNPVYPSAFLALTSTLAIFVVYIVGKKFGNRVTGIIAAILTAFSFDIFLASRWLSNPTPILLTSILFFWGLILNQ